MVAVVGNKVTFSKDRVVQATQVSKNFGQMRRHAKTEPLFVSDRSSGIDTVILGFEEFEKMATLLEELKEKDFYARAAARVRDADTSDESLSIPLEDAMGAEEFSQLLHEAQDSSAMTDSELFE